MAGVNKVIIVGRLGNEPEMRAMPNGEAVANISIATSESWTDKNTGERREVTEWHRVVFYRRQAEVCGEYLHKGSQVYIEGRLKTRKWQDQSGKDRYTTEIQGDLLQMLGDPKSTQAPAPVSYTHLTLHHNRKRELQQIILMMIFRFELSKRLCQ